ncbi:Cyclin [Quillaja saponaria]|uniref:B-like cyclin n=1 Tax=Quillaja saponaria TaxID=32244 RepID=A0AAD7LJ86_QUISA|nr:Cyclin [Quillaja saponaria]
MSTRNRYGSSSSSSSTKRSSFSENLSKKKTTSVKTLLEKKRPALVDVTNQRNGSVAGGRAPTSVPSKPLVPCASRVSKMKDSVTCSQKDVIYGNTLPASMTVKSSVLVPSKDTSLKKRNQPKGGVAAIHDRSSIDVELPELGPIVCAPRMMDVSQSRSFSGSVSMDESMSTCDSLKSPEFEYIDCEDVSAVKSVERRETSSLNFWDNSQVEGKFYASDAVLKTEINDEVVNIDNNLTDPQFCASIACDIYKHLRETEASKRPTTHFMEKIQKDINASMRAVLIDWLVEVAEEYRLLPDTLFLTVNYIDRYLSSNTMIRQRLQLLGVACVMIAAKYEEIRAPLVEEFCSITDNTYSREEVLQMESAVLNYLKFEMTAPTARCFLRRFVCVAQGTCKVPSMQLECLTNYLAELSLLDYSMLRFTQSLIAASATFLAKFILNPRKKPWDSTLRYYTDYKASELCDCVMALHHLCCSGSFSNLPAVREKYSQHKYKFVAKKYCPPSIPSEFFQDLSNYGFTS